MAKESWLQRIHVKLLMDRSYICIFIQNFDKDILQHSVIFSCKKQIKRRGYGYRNIQRFTLRIRL
ncbi:hypothetical protein EW027_17780 [Aeribacillus pallidus]|nr:hypothetical protein EW027_17780 [Aeribacillus pallidus]